MMKRGRRGTSGSGGGGGFEEHYRLSIASYSDDLVAAADDFVVSNAVN